MDANEDEESEFAIPGWFRLLLAALSGLFFTVLIVLYLAYLESPETLAPPSELGLPALMIFSGSFFLLVAVPWWKWGLSIQKIGPFEFTRALGRQQKDTNDSIVYLQKQIEELQQKYEGSEDHKMSQMVYGPEIENAISRYFLKYPGAVSPRKLLSLVQKVEELQPLHGKDYLLVRSTLRELVTKGILETSVSRKGNTLYKLSL